MMLLLLRMCTKATFRQFFYSDWKEGGKTSTSKNGVYIIKKYCSFVRAATITHLSINMLNCRCHTILPNYRSPMTLAWEKKNTNVSNSIYGWLKKTSRLFVKDINSNENFMLFDWNTMSNRKISKEYSFLCVCVWI